MGACSSTIAMRLALCPRERSGNTKTTPVTGRVVGMAVLVNAVLFTTEFGLVDCYLLQSVFPNSLQNLCTLSRVVASCFFRIRFDLVPCYFSCMVFLACILE